MTGFMQPPVADEPAPRPVKHLVFTIVALIVIILILFRLTRAPVFDETDVILVPATSENYARASEAYRRGDVAAAYGLLRPSADAGDVASQLTIGWMHATGFGGRYLEDRCKAMPWFDKAARAGDPFAMAMLSDSYFRGAGVERDPTLANLWFRAWQTRSGDAAERDPLFSKALNQELAWFSDELDDLMAKDPAIAAQLTSWDYRTAAPVVPRSLPDIPGIDTLVQLLLIKSQGCRATLFATFTDDQIVVPEYIGRPVYERPLTDFPDRFGRP